MLVEIDLAAARRRPRAKCSSARGSRSGSARTRSGPPRPGCWQVAEMRRAFSIDSGVGSAISGSSISSERRITSVFEKTEPIGVLISCTIPASRRPIDGHLVQFGGRWSSLLHQFAESLHQRREDRRRDLAVVGQQVVEIVAADAQQPGVFDGLARSPGIGSLSSNSAHAPSTSFCRATVEHFAVAAQFDRAVHDHVQRIGGLPAPG